MKKNNKKKVLIIIIGIVFIVLGFVLGYNLNNKRVTNYRIRYYYKNNIYDIEPGLNKYVITKYNVVYCIQAPCEPVKERITYTAYNAKNKEIVNKYLKNKKYSEIHWDKLTNEENLILLEFVFDQDKNLGKEYEILETSDYDSKYNKRGYYLDKELITIAMGEQSTGGYSIKIAKIIIEDKDVQIYIEEDKPSSKDVVTMAFTYPIARVKFNFIPNKILVQSLDSYENFKRIE